MVILMLLIVRMHILFVSFNFSLSRVIVCTLHTAHNLCLQLSMTLLNQEIQLGYNSKDVYNFICVKCVSGMKVNGYPCLVSKISRGVIYSDKRIMAMNKPNLYGIKCGPITSPFHRTCKKRDKNNKSRYCIDVM